MNKLDNYTENHINIKIHLNVIVRKKLKFTLIRLGLLRKKTIYKL